MVLSPLRRTRPGGGRRPTPGWGGGGMARGTTAAALRLPLALSVTGSVPRGSSSLSLSLSPAPHPLGGTLAADQTDNKRHQTRKRLEWDAQRLWTGACPQRPAPAPAAPWQVDVERAAPRADAAPGGGGVLKAPPLPPTPAPGVTYKAPRGSVAVPPPPPPPGSPRRPLSAIAGKPPYTGRGLRCRGRFFLKAIPGKRVVRVAPCSRVALDTPPLMIELKLKLYLCFQSYSFVYDVDDEMGASRGREKHPCFYNASGSF